MIVITLIVIYLIALWIFTKSLYKGVPMIKDEVDDQQEPKEEIKTENNAPI